MGRKVERMPARQIPLFQSALLFSQSDRHCTAAVNKMRSAMLRFYFNDVFLAETF